MNARILVVDDDLCLRKLIEDDPSLPRMIQTVRGHGYLFVPDP